MKSLVTLLLVSLLSFSARATDKIAFKNKESFNVSCENNYRCSDIQIMETPESTIENFLNYVTANASIMNASRENGIIRLSLSGEKSERVVYQKLFYKLGVFDIEILEGDSKGVYSVDQFLDLYNL